MADDKPLLTVPEAAGYLGLRPSTIRSWLLKREIPYIKLRRRAVRIRRADLETLVEKGTVPAKQEERR